MAVLSRTPFPDVSLVKGRPEVGRSEHTKPGKSGWDVLAASFACLELLSGA